MHLLGSNKILCTSPIEAIVVTLVPNTPQEGWELNILRDTTRLLYDAPISIIQYCLLKVWSCDEVTNPNSIRTQATMLACQLAQNLAGTDNKSLQQHQACLFFWSSCLARAASQRRATITQAGTGGRYQAVQAFCICSAAADVLALVSCRTSSARAISSACCA